MLAGRLSDKMSSELGYYFRVIAGLFLFSGGIQHENTTVTLVPLTPGDREQFILDNQWAFKYGALLEFGERDDHIDDDGEIISRDTIERCIDDPRSETYRIVSEGRNVGGVILKIDRETHHNELEILFTLPEEHS